MKTKNNKNKSLIMNKKLERICKLFDEIKRTLPDSDISLDIHDINDMDLLDKDKWLIEKRINAYSKNEFYFTATRNNEIFDIALFSDMYNMEEKWKLNIT